MKRDDIKKLLGETATDDIVDSVMALHNKDLTKSQTAAETAQTEASTLKAQLAEANTAIEGFKKLNPEQLQIAADEWKTKAEQAEDEAKKNLYDFKFNSRLSSKLKDEFGVKNPKRVISDLDKSLLKYDEEKDDVIGDIAGQLKPIQEKEDYLFDTETPEPKTVIGGRSQTTAKESTLADAIGQKLGLQGK
jgi:hypothetical protein